MKPEDMTIGDLLRCLDPRDVHFEAALGELDRRIADLVQRVGRLEGKAPIASVSDNPYHCEHPNEAPISCPCKAGCYCKTRTCKPATEPAKKPYALSEQCTCGLSFARHGARSPYSIGRTKDSDGCAGFSPAKKIAGTCFHLWERTPNGPLCRKCGSVMDLPNAAEKNAAMDRQRQADALGLTLTDDDPKAEKNAGGDLENGIRSAKEEPLVDLGSFAEHAGGDGWVELRTLSPGEHFETKGRRIGRVCVTQERLTDLPPKVRVVGAREVVDLLDPWLTVRRLLVLPDDDRAIETIAVAIFQADSHPENKARSWDGMHPLHRKRYTGMAHAAVAALRALATKGER